MPFAATSRRAARLSVALLAIAILWALPADSTEATGWIATATPKGRTTRSCTLAGTAITQVADAAATCTIIGLVKGVTYKVTLVAWSAPAGPSPRVDLCTVKTLR